MSHRTEIDNKTTAHSKSLIEVSILLVTTNGMYAVLKLCKSHIRNRIACALYYFMYIVQIQCQENKQLIRNYVLY